MDENYNSSVSNFQINMIEYCTLMKDIILPGATTARVKVNKLMTHCSEGKQKTSNSMYANDDECKPQVSGQMETSDYITVSIMDCPFGNDVGIPIFSEMVDQEGTVVSIQTGVKIPKGSLMIVLFMDQNINDGYLTPWIVR